MSVSDRVRSAGAGAGAEAGAAVATATATATAASGSGSGSASGARPGLAASARPAWRLWPKLRRTLFWTHRWLGIAGCLLFVMWFASGLVMMYVGYPSLTSEERLRGLSPLSTTAVNVSADTVLSRLPADVRQRPPRRMALEMMADAAPPLPMSANTAPPSAQTPARAQSPRPVWRIVDAKGRPHAFWADSGQRVGPVDAGQAEQIARGFTGSADARAEALIDRDQWTVPQGLDPQRPLHRVALLDDAGTELYISSVTGEVVRDTTRRERLWNWLGAVPHWIYFTPLRADAPLWRTVVIWISGVCMVAAVTGVVLGLMRIRLRPRARYRDGRCSPYAGWMRWHHIAGLLGGLFLVTWIISGWLSMDPNRWFQRAASDEAAVHRWQGLAPIQTPLSASSDESSVTTQTATSLLPALPELPLTPPPPDTRELLLHSFNSRPLLEWRQADGARLVVDAASGRPVQLSRSEMVAAARRYLPGSSAVSVEWLTHEDAYWYGHHGRRTLPVWRVELADSAGTWLHVDPATGQIVGTSDKTARLRRWLFNAPHSLDFPWLIQQRPAWDVVMWTLSSLGLVISVSGVVVGWRRLMRTKSR